MYRLLVVDDEDFITDSLARLLESTPQFELDVYKAYSAFEAIEYLNRYSFDIVVTDIQMPGMSGIELLKEIHDKWVSCQVVFLTGHDKFEYAYQAIQYHAVRYVLKNEGDDVLLSAIAECISVIERDAHNEELLSRAREEARLYKPLIRRSFLQSILVGQPPDAGQILPTFKQMGVCLDPGQPVMLLAARVSAEQNGYETASVDVVLREKIGHTVRSEIGWADARIIIWIVQPVNELSVERAQITIRGMAEIIQRICEGTLGIGITFVFDAASISWEQVAVHFSILRHVVENRLEKHTEIAIAGLEFFLGAPYNEGSTDKPAFLQYMGIIDKLSTAMANDDISETDLCVNRLLAIFSDNGVRQEADLYTLELHTALRLILLSYATRHELQDTFRNDAAFRSFLSGSDLEEPCWRIEQFRQLARRMISLCVQERHRSGEAFIGRLLQYMSNHLDADLSLCALSEIVYLNPSYLSRRFKELTGKTITDKITELRIMSACRLLEDNAHRISKISTMVGYESAAHFSRVFKRQLGMTPQEYRDKKAK